MTLLLGFVTFAVVVFAAKAWRDERRYRAREAARRVFEEDQSRHGRDAARARCPHAFKTFTQTGVPGVVTMTKRWCAVCRLDLGAAEHVSGWFGDYWR